MTKDRAQEIFLLLKTHYPKASMILEWTNNFELLVSIILSAQCTDKKVNEVTAKVFPKYRTIRPEFKLQYNKFMRMVIPTERVSKIASKKEHALSREEIVELVNFTTVSLVELEHDIKSTGFYHNKAKSVQGAAKCVLETYNGELPNTIAKLITIPGVGRKTANVFLGNAYGIYEGIAVDTHVSKQSQKLGLTSATTPDKIEQELMKLFPQTQWFPLTYLLIEHGRNMRKKKSDRYSCGIKNCLLCN